MYDVYYLMFRARRRRCRVTHLLVAVKVIPATSFVKPVTRKVKISCRLHVEEVE